MFTEIWGLRHSSNILINFFSYELFWSSSFYRSEKRELSQKARLSHRLVFVLTPTYDHELWVPTKGMRSWIETAEMIFHNEFPGLFLRDRVRSSVSRLYIQCSSTSGGASWVGLRVLGVSKTFGRGLGVLPEELEDNGKCKCANIQMQICKTQFTQYNFKPGFHIFRQTHFGGPYVGWISWQSPIVICEHQICGS